MVEAWAITEETEAAAEVEASITTGVARVSILKAKI